MLPVQTPEISYIANGATTVFAYPFKVFSSADLQVRIDGTLAVLNIDYTVTGVGVQTGGTVVFASAPDNGAAVYIRRSIPLSRDIEYQHQGDFASPTVNRDFDRLWGGLQDAGLLTDRALHLPPGDNASTELPSLADRALRGAAFDADGNVVAATSSDASSLSVILADKTSSNNGSGAVGYRYPAPDAVGRTANERFADQLSLKDFGAQGDGVTDDGPALQKALDYCKANELSLFVPCGTFKINTPVVLTSATGVRIRGSGVNNTYFTRSASGTMLTLDGCSRCGIYDIAFDGTAMASGDGIRVIGSNVGVIEICNNQFSNFPGRGLLMNCDPVIPASSCLIENNVFIGCGIDDATAQLEARYVNDSRFMGNQVGNNGLVGPYMPFGVLLFHCQAGNYEANYHWECTVGGQYDDCDYTRFIGNRWETNQREGAKFFNSSQLTIDGNHVHTNSMQLSGTYAGITFDTCSASNITSNLVYTWNATLMSYSMVVSNDCQDMVIDGNRFAGYATEPVSFNIGSVNIKLTNNQPPQNRISQSDGTWLQIASSIGAITAGNTRYLGSNGSSPNDGEVGFVVPRPCTATGLRVNHTVAPGASESYTFTLRKNLADTSFVITSNGGSQFGASGVGSINFNAGDLLSVKVVASAGAATATMIGSVVLDG